MGFYLLLRRANIDGDVMGFGGLGFYFSALQDVCARVQFAMQAIPHTIIERPLFSIWVLVTELLTQLPIRCEAQAIAESPNELSDYFQGAFWRGEPGKDGAIGRL